MQRFDHPILLAAFAGALIRVNRGESRSRNA
jgi:hypothetical protein